MTPKQREVWELHQQGISGRAIARQLGIAENAVRNRLSGARKHAEADGAIQGAMSSVGMQDAGPLHSGWIKSEGASLYFQMPKDKRASVTEIVREAFEGIPAAPPVAAPQHTLDDLLTLYPITDAHIGMKAWGQEVGEDYDTDIAVERLTSWVGRAVASAPASKTAVVLDVGDLTHSDDQNNMTPKSKHVLDADTRHFKTIDMTIFAMATAVDLASAKHEKVIVRILPGNHNPHSYLAILFGLAERYRDSARVEVQKIPGEFFTHQFGKCLIAAHHGDKAKAERIVMFLADEFSELWGATRHRYLWTGHLHHHKSADIGGVTWEQLRAITSRDAYASTHFYSARSQLQAITYHKELGEVERVKVSGP
jgi:hypothetical protein